MIINRQIIVYIFSLVSQCHATQKGDADVASVSRLDVWNHGPADAGKRYRRSFCSPSRRLESRVSRT